MSFIKIHPLTAIESLNEDDFGRGHPARCRAERSFGSRELFLNVNQIAAFEECPLYLVSEADPNALVNGIRLRLVSGQVLVVADDPEEGAQGFMEALARACAGQIAAVGYSSHLLELERARRLGP